VCVCVCVVFPPHSFLTQYKGVYERDVKCEVKMSHYSGTVTPRAPSPSKDTEVSLDLGLARYSHRKVGSRCYTSTTVVHINTVPSHLITDQWDALEH